MNMHCSSISTKNTDPSTKEIFQEFEKEKEESTNTEVLSPTTVINVKEIMEIKNKDDVDISNSTIKEPGDHTDNCELDFDLDNDNEYIVAEKEEKKDSIFNSEEIIKDIDSMENIVINRRGSKSENYITNLNIYPVVPCSLEPSSSQFCSNNDSNQNQNDSKNTINNKSSAIEIKKTIMNDNLSGVTNKSTNTSTTNNTSIANNNINSAASTNTTLTRKKEQVNYIDTNHYNTIHSITNNTDINSLNNKGRKKNISKDIQQTNSSMYEINKGIISKSDNQLQHNQKKLKPSSNDIGNTSCKHSMVLEVNNNFGNKTSETASNISSSINSFGKLKTIINIDSIMNKYRRSNKTINESLMDDKTIAQSYGSDLSSVCKYNRNIPENNMNNKKSCFHVFKKIIPKNIRFYWSSRLNNINNKKLTKQALKIYNTFINPGAPFELYINSNTIQFITDEINLCKENHQISEDIFNQAYVEVLHNLFYSSYQKYILYESNSKKNRNMN